MARLADALNLKKMFGIDIDEASRLLDDYDGDIDAVIQELGDRKGISLDTKGKAKKPKEKRLFKVGDIIKCIDANPGKLPPDCVQFLNTYNSFKVKEVNPQLNIDLGYILESNGHQYFFAPHRFELKKGTAPLVMVGPEGIINNPTPESVKVEPTPMPEPPKAKKNLFDEARKAATEKRIKGFGDYDPEEDEKNDFFRPSKKSKIDIGRMGDDTKFEVYPKEEDKYDPSK